MKTERKILAAALVALAVMLSLLALDEISPASAQGPRPGGRRAPRDLAGTGFIYQGQLKKSGALLNSTCNFTFTLYSDVGGTTPVGSSSSVSGVNVVSGLFTATVNGSGEIGASAFNGDARWLKTAVKCAGDGGVTTLSPLQALTPAPYALALPGLYTQQNGGAAPANIIGGFSGNTVDNGALGATISGGGDSGTINHISASYGTIGGGYSNTIASTGGQSTIGGGTANTASGALATIGGGLLNMASGNGATIGGGGFDGTSFLGNSASGNGSTISGGMGNTASQTLATISGGNGNTASGMQSIIGGGTGNVANATWTTVGGGAANSVTFQGGTIAGGYNNSASGSHAFIGGGNTNHASGDFSTISGGGVNTTTNTYGTVGGGTRNLASGPGSFVGGGGYDGTNFIGSTASGKASTIGGGINNTANGDYASIGGGSNNVASNQYSTISGGQGNTASGFYATVPGGSSALASHYAEEAYSSGSFAAKGDAQISTYVLRRITTNATPVYMYLDGTSSLVTIALTRSLTFDILVVARRDSSNESAGYHFRGVLKNDGGTTSFVGVPVKEVLGEDDSTWDVNIYADDTNDILGIAVTGASSKTIRWVATVHTVEVAW